MNRSRITLFDLEPTYSSSWKALVSLLQAKGGKSGTNVQGQLDLTDSDHLLDLLSKINGMSGRSLTVCSPRIASEVGSHQGHSTPHCQVHCQEMNIPTAAIVGP